MRPLIPVLDAGQAAAWDEKARQAGSPSRVLMESAGRGTAFQMGRLFADRMTRGVLVCVGHGNNGGDGWVIARALHAVGIPTWVVEYEKERSPDCQANRDLALHDGVESLGVADEWPHVDLIVDALLGTGASGRPRGVIAEVGQKIADCHSATVVAVDGPTGLDLTTGEAHGPVRADVTVTFGGLRRGHLLSRDWCGRLIVLDIGFGSGATDPSWPTLVEQRWANSVLPDLTTTMHKGTRGRILIIGGEDGMAGAVHYAAMAAFGAGAGLVRLATQSQSAAALQKNFPDAAVLAVNLAEPADRGLLDAIQWADALVVGPGLGRAVERIRFVAAILESASCPLVLDADALHVGLDTLQLGVSPRVFTPHEGEFHSLFPNISLRDTDRFAAVGEATRRVADANGTILLKGVPTVLSADNLVRVVAAGNPGLATGGSGDILSGLIAAFLAAGLTTVDAASLGALALGAAADLAAESISVRAMRPINVIQMLPEVWKQWQTPVYHEPPVLLNLPMPTLR